MTDEPRPFQRIAAVVVAVLFVTLVVHYDAVGPPQTELLEDILLPVVRADSETTDERERFGGVEAVRCREWGGRTFRGATTFLCDVEYADQALAMRCAAIVDGTLYTDSSRALHDCVPRVAPVG